MNRRVAVVVSHPIQHFCPQYVSWSNIGGVELKVFFASRRGLDAYFDKDFKRTVKWDSLNLDFPHEFLGDRSKKSLSSASRDQNLAEHLGEFAPDCVLAYGYSQSIQRRAIKWAGSSNTPVLMIADSELRQKRGWLRGLIKAIVLPQLFGKIDIFLTVGDANESYYRKYGVHDRKLVRCFFPIDTSSFDSVSMDRRTAKMRVREKLGIPDEHVVILKVGKLVPWKRQMDLVRFSNLLQKTESNVTVVLAGTGPSEDLLRAAVTREGPGGVIFAGFVAPRDLTEYYAAADIYAHCAEIEPHSLAISEAIYSGLPVVLSDRCGSYGPSDDVRPGLNGFVYACGNIEGMSRVLNTLIGQRELRRKMGRASEGIARSNQVLAHGVALQQAIELLNIGSASL